VARIELEGMDELISKVNKLGSKGMEIKQKALARAGKLVKASMESKAPRSDQSKTHMADNIAVSDIKQENGVDFVQVGPTKGDNSPFFYSKFTEWGTSKISAQHWAEKSVRENKGQINNLIREELERGLNGD